jgi:hypothetical protein
VAVNTPQFKRFAMNQPLFTVAKRLECGGFSTAFARKGRDRIDEEFRPYERRDPIAFGIPAAIQNAAEKLPKS